MIDTAKRFTLQRDFHASRPRVWQAWTDPNQMAEWMHPEGVHTDRESVSADPQPGGRYTYTMVVDTTGEQFPTAGNYLEVEPPSRLVMTWGTPHDPTDELLHIVVELTELDGDNTRMTFTCIGIDETPEQRHGVREGWDSAFTILGAYVDVRV